MSQLAVSVLKNKKCKPVSRVLYPPVGGPLSFVLLHHCWCSLSVYPPCPPRRVINEPLTLSKQSLF